MNQFRFANVEWIHAMWLVSLLAVLLVALELRGVRVLEKMLSPLMQGRLVHRPSVGRRVVAVLLLCGSLAALVIGLMRPQWGSTMQLQTRVDSQIMICLDVSRSMLAEDVVPNRLERAKAEIDSLLSLMKDGQQVGLMAFAGKASVLCPLTTDFGFLRLILAEANPATVGLGGTRIGEALTKGVDGFREVGDVNRLILLITDGEDHESFPLDAAKLAKEKGVRIVSIGFGDELGSKISVTDPRTGARSMIEDRDGNPVISRLDGETLRDIAMETEGAYIPAGTGALDWQSIYQAHIAGFLRGTTAEEETVVRNEAYQWCVMVALVLMLIALATPTLFAKESVSSRLGLVHPTKSARAALWLAFCVGLFIVNESSQIWAQATPQPTIDPSPQTAHSDAANKALSNAEVKPTSAGQEPKEIADNEEGHGTPRELYNRAIALVSTDYDRAEKLLNASRREAGVDGELRYRALYNLGWVEVNRADKLLPAEPEQALKHLELAAGRFREAIRVRPESDEARHNLEIISRRILELSDALAEKDSQEFAPRLDELIVRIREHQSELQKTCTSVASDDAPLEKFRNEFRQLGVSQRQIISDLEKLADDARRQLAAEKATPQSQSPQTGSQPAVQSAQLSSMLGYLDSAVQRMHKARSFVRRLQSERAFVRWAAALTETKRARDQLRDPLEILGVLIGDATEQLDLTRTMHLSESPLMESQPQVKKPNWLSDELLSDGQLATVERTSELQTLLTAAVEQSQSSQTPLSQPSQAGNPQVEPNLNEDVQTLIANIENALPAIENAKNHFSKAHDNIADRSWKNTLEDQLSGIEELMKAAEVFFDIRRLIDGTLADQRGIHSALVQIAETNPSNSDDLQKKITPSKEILEAGQAALLNSQQKNLQRCERMAQMLQQELQAAEEALHEAGTSTSAGNQSSTAATGNAVAANSAERDAERERLELALQLRAVAEQAMHKIADAIETQGLASLAGDSANQPSETERPPSPRRKSVQKSDQQPEVVQFPSELLTHSQEAVNALEELQRLFFSVVEHLRETAQRQAELNDGTTELLAQPNQQTPQRIGPLQHRQQSLHTTAQAIAEALEQQASSLDTAPPPAANAPSTAPDSVDASKAELEKLTQAAQLVREGGEAMELAANKLTSVTNPVQTAGQEDTAESASTEQTKTLDSKSQPVEATRQDKDGQSKSNGAQQENGAQHVTGEGPLGEVAAEQQTALQKLLEALELLDPQQSDNQNQQQQQQQQPQEKSDEQMESTPQNMDAEQMLQAIREREANRRRERQPQQATSASGVEKDW